MRETTIKIEMDKNSLRDAVTRILEHITANPPAPDEFSDMGRINYNLGVNALFACLRQTFE